VHNYKQVYLQWIICIFIQIIFINIQNLQHKTLSCNMITYSFIGSLSSKGPTFSKNSYMLTWRTCRLRQLEIKMSLSVILCMSSDRIWDLQWIICIFIQIIFINIQNLQHKNLSCKLINLLILNILYLPIFTIICILKI
jgi:hypothetical protein